MIRKRRLVWVLLIWVTGISHARGPGMLMGIVVDGGRKPIGACNLIIKGTVTGTVTNECGEFSLSPDTNEFTLLFHAMSYDDLRVYELKLSKADVLGQPIIFQIGKGKAAHTTCEKTLDPELKCYQIP